MVMDGQGLLLAPDACFATRLCKAPNCMTTWAPSQYKDRLIYVWRFPC